MSFEDWELFPRMPAWKYEFFRHPYTTIRPFGPHYRIAVEPRTVDAPCEIRPVKPEDARALRQAFTEAFLDYTDYIYATERQVRKVGGDLIWKFFARGEDDLCRRASCLAVDPANSNRVIGAALLAPTRASDESEPSGGLTQLEPVFVVPDWQRRGVATALVSEVLKRLGDSGEEVLESGCSDYNRASKRWHLRLGAVETEESRYYTKTPFFSWIRGEIFRQRGITAVLGIPFDHGQMERMAEWWSALAKELDELDEFLYPSRIPRRHTYYDQAREHLEYWKNHPPSSKTG
jgi:GNAT superfamily N-acetyltransferase